jgi:hypothetical protein
MKDFGNGLKFNYETPKEVQDLILAFGHNHWLNGKIPTADTLENMANDAAYSQFCDDCSDDSRYWSHKNYGVGHCFGGLVDKTTFADYEANRNKSEYFDYLVKLFDDLCNHGKGRAVTEDDKINLEEAYYNKLQERLLITAAKREENERKDKERREQYHQFIEKAKEMAAEVEVTDAERDAAGYISKLYAKVPGYDWAIRDSSFDDAVKLVIAQNRSKIAKKVAEMVTTRKSNEKIEVRALDLINNLQGWDRTFLRSVVIDQKRTALTVSLKQLIQLDRICNEALGVKFSQVIWKN